MCHVTVVLIRKHGGVVYGGKQGTAEGVPKLHLPEGIEYWSQIKLLTCRSWCLYRTQWQSAHAAIYRNAKTVVDELLA